jgi:hypothetical protein
MKTLDEVIKAYEICHASVLSCEGCPYDNGERYRDSDCYIADALHYLKEYREKHDDILRMEEALGYCEIMDNPPLDWEQLKQMEGKPVWVEVYDPIDDKTGWHTASWKLIEFINDEYFDVRNSDGEQECFYKSENDCYCWQAYRKERK